MLTLCEAFHTVGRDVAVAVSSSMMALIAAAGLEHRWGHIFLPKAVLDSIVVQPDPDPKRAFNIQNQYKLVCGEFFFQKQLSHLINLIWTAFKF